MLEERDNRERVIEQLLSAVGLEEGNHYAWSNLFGYEEAIVMAGEQVSEILQQRDEAQGRSIVNKTALEMQKEARDQLRARVAELEKDKELLDWLAVEIGDGAAGALVRVANLMHFHSLTFRQAIYAAMKGQQ